MPQAIPLIILGVTAASSAIPSIIGMLNQPGTPKAPTATPTGPTTDQARAAITPQAMTIESLTGGSVSPDYLATIAPIVAGVGGQPNTNNAMQQVLQEIFGKGGGTPGSSGSGMPTMPGMTSTTPFTPTGTTPNIGALAQTPGLSDFLQKLAGGIA